MADSHATAAESDVGTLRSDAFTLSGSGIITFLIAGYNGHPTDTPPNTWNYVTLNLASDNTEVTRVWAPGSDSFSIAVLDGSTAVGQSVYLQVVDDGYMSGFAWIAVDNFQLVVPAGINGNGNFETGDFTGWSVVEGDAWGTAPIVNGTHGGVTGYEGTYSADSFFGPSGEASTGILKSDNFTLTGSGFLRFLLGGCNYWPGVNDPNSWNYVTINRASDNQEIKKIFAPQSNVYVTKVVNLSAFIGVPLYLKVVDDSDLGSYGWIGIDKVEEAGDITPYAGSGINGNGNFELSTFENWTIVSGTAWGTEPIFKGTHSTVTGVEGNYFADSYMLGEAQVGVIRSNNFTLTGTGLLGFKIAGHNYWPGSEFGEHSWNYVTLNRASNGEELAHIWAPGSDAFSTQMFNAKAYLDTELYVEAVDNGDQGSYAWMAVDDFREITGNPPSGINGNGNFEMGDYTGWTVVEGDAWGTGPVIGGTHSTATGYEGTFCADSFLGTYGESSTGILRSNNFTLTTTGILSFLIAGFHYYPEVTDPFSWNYVELKRASDGLVIERVYAPFANEFSKRTIDAKAYMNVPLYLDVVDDGALSGFAWIAVDDVKEADIPVYPATGINGNGNFELGTFQGWTVVEGGAWGTKPVVSGSHATVTNPEGSYYADSFPGGEVQTGILRSNTFTLSKEAISLMIAGFNCYPGRDPENTWNYVALCKADGTEIDRVWAPGANTFSTFLLLAKGMAGQSVYVEAVDNAADTGFAWMAIDNVFETDPPEEPTFIFDDFETGTIDPAKWTTSNDTWKALAAGQGFGSNPYEGSYRGASSYDGSASTDALVGSMTSTLITVGPTDGWIAWYMQGWDSQTGGAGQNYVDIVTANGTLIQRVTPPLQDSWKLDVQVPINAYRGQQIRMICVDGRSDGFGWIGVDYIRMLPGDPLSIDDWIQY